jgi:glycerol-3-phosphate dehydrogenase subunit B
MPPTSDTELLAKADSIVVVGIKGMKDFYPELMIEGLKKRKSYASKSLSALILESPYESKRDITALDIARYVDSEAGINWLIQSLSAHKGSTLIVPPILGTKPSAAIFDRLMSAGLQCFETPVMPPSTPGMRLRQLLLDNAKRCGVEVIEMGDVCRADVSNGRCTAVYTTAADKERVYTADKFVIATGGFFGGGCIAEPGKAYEAIFGLDLGAPAKQIDWSQPSLLGTDAHIFASMGVRANAQLKPIDASGAVLLENVHFVGRTLGGYDFAVEKSGNGVALATGYLAGRI